MIGIKEKAVSLGSSKLPLEAAFGLSKFVR